MGLESATHVNQLNPANPVGGVDNYSTADDHLRLVKSTLTTDFPNIGGVVTATHTQLSFVTGVTSAIQTQLDAKEALANKNANSGYAGLDGSAQLADARVKASNVTQHQASLALAGSQITSGTVPTARLASGTANSASWLRGDQTWQAILTSDVSSGTFVDARIAQSNVTQHQAALSIATTQLTGNMPDARIIASNVTQHQTSLSIAATQLTGSIADARVQQSNVTQHAAALITRNISAKTGVVKTLQSGGSPSGGSDGDIIYIY